MKKLITTLLLSLLSVICVLAFTACGGDKKEEEVRTTVTEEEWKTAVTQLYDGKHNVDGKITMEFTEETETVIYDFKYNHTNQFFWYKYGNKDYYFWNENDKYYEYGFEFENAYKDEVDKDDYEELIDDFYKEMACGYFVLDGVAENYSFSALTYDEENKVYKATFEQEEISYDCTMKFENGNLVKFVGVNEQFLTVTVEYNHGNFSLIIPQTIIDMAIE